MDCRETWCRVCGGDGGFAYPVDLCRSTGALIEGWDRCSACVGTGGMSEEEAADFDLAERDEAFAGDPGWEPAMPEGFELDGAGTGIAPA